MAKKEKNQEVVMALDNNEVKVEDEPLFEAEAYGSPQPEAGSDVTVLKPVGTGGPVPIVAPKHNTIQLQPIVVPLAVVPYMTQDSNVLRTDGNRQGGYAAGSEYGEATDFENVSAQKTKKRGKIQPRIFALVSFLLSALLVLPFILSHFVANIGNASLAEFDIIGAIQGWLANGFNLHPLCNLAYIAVTVFCGLEAVISLIAVVIGRYPRAFDCVMSILSAAALLAVLIKQCVEKTFSAPDRIIFIVICAVALLSALLAVIFSILQNKLEDKLEAAEINREI